MNLKSSLVGLALLSLSFRPAFAQSPLWTNLVSYWPFDTVAGGVTPDLSLGNDLPLVSAPTLVAGISNNCFQFDGVSQFLGLTHSSSSLDTGLPIYSTSGYTVAFWAKGSSVANNKTLFAVGNSGNTGPLFNLATKTANKLNLFLRNDAGSALLNNVGSATVVFDGNWHHIAWVDNNGSAKLYIDGVQDATSFNYTATPTQGPTLNNTSVGALYRTPPANFFTGFIDELMLWKRALSQAEVLAVMTNGIPQPIPPTPPTFTAQPASSTNALGDRALFVAHVYGTRPMTFQWYSNSVPFTGQTNSTLLLTSLTNPATNIYSLVASNVTGSVTSNPAMLVVLPDAAPNVAAGLVSFWPLDTVTNSPVTNTPDLYSQNNLLLTLMDSNNLVAGEFGNALSFDGATQYGSLASGTPVYNLSTVYTVAFWVKGAPGQTNRQIFANGNTTNASDFFLIGTDNANNSGRLDVKVSPGFTDTLSTGTALDGSWHHVVWVDQNGTGLLYLDGQLDPTVYSYTRGTVPLNTTSVGALLRASVSNYFAGSLDDLAFWSRRLSYSEIQAVRTTGVPPPVSIVKASITSLVTQPVNLTNSVYPDDSVTLTVQASGTAPLSYQWQKDGAPISAGANPSAVSNVLSLVNVQTNDSGFYSVIVTNAGGAVTSSVVQLAVIPYTPATTGTVLQVAFNFGAAPITQPGFSSMTLNGNPATFNGPEVSLSTIGSTSFSDRSRTVMSNSPPQLTQAALYNQFIFSTSSSAGTGIDIHLRRLAPNTTFGVTLWSWDNQNRVTADWTEVASGTPATVQAGYFFNGSTLPAADYDDTLGALVTSTATGELEFQGVVDSGTSGIFINGLRLIANPAIRITAVRIAADGNLQLAVETQYPNQSIEFLENPDLNPNNWGPALDLVSTVTHGPIVTAEFAISAAQMFIRVVSP